MKRKSSSAVCFSASLMLIAVSTFPKESFADNVIILSSKFRGDENSSERLTNLFRLQVSSTFRRTSTETLGRMIWDDIAVGSHLEANERGVNVASLAHMVMWGNTYQLNDGIALQTYLTVTDLYWRRGSVQNLPGGIWVVRVPLPDDKERKLSLGLPRNMFRLPEAIYASDAADPFPSLNNLPIYSDRSFRDMIGRTSTGYRALQYTSNSVEVVSGGTRGWVRIDSLTRENNAAVNLIGAIFRITRGDYKGALDLLDKADLETNGDIDVSSYSLVLRGLCQELLGQSGIDSFDRARKLAPLDVSIARYSILSRIASISRAKHDERQKISELRALVDETRPFFAPSSRWLGTIDSYLLSKQ